MTATGNFSKLSNIMGNYRNFLKTRVTLPMYQPHATLKQTVEEKLGLPAKPKRPKSPYLMFIAQIRPSIKEKNPDAKITELTKIMAQEWNKADSGYKAKLEESYQSELLKYQQAKAAYNDSITPAQKTLLENYKSEGKVTKEKKIFQKTLQDLGKPRRPPSAMALYVRSLGEKRGTIPLSQWQKLNSTKYEALPASEKEIFEKTASQAMNDYRIELQKWEDKMAKSGQLSDATTEKRDTSHEQSTISSMNPISVKLQRNLADNSISRVDNENNDNDSSILRTTQSPSISVTSKNAKYLEDPSQSNPGEVSSLRHERGNKYQESRVYERSEDIKLQLDNTQVETRISVPKIEENSTQNRVQAPKNASKLVEGISSIKETTEKTSNDELQMRINDTRKIEISDQTQQKTRFKQLLQKWSEEIISKLKSMPFLESSKLHREYVYFSALAMTISILCFYNLMYHP